MLWLAISLVVVAAVCVVAGFVLFANGAGVAPRRRTEEDPTGFKRAGSRVAWPDVFRRMPSSPGVMLDKDAARDDKLTALGAMLVLAALLAGFGAVLAFVSVLVPR